MLSHRSKNSGNHNLTWENYSRRRNKKQEWTNLNPWLCKFGGKLRGRRRENIFIVLEKLLSIRHICGRSSSRISWVAVAEKYGEHLDTQIESEISMSLKTKNSSSSSKNKFYKLGQSYQCMRLIMIIMNELSPPIEYSPVDCEIISCDQSSLSEKYLSIIFELLWERNQTRTARACRAYQSIFQRVDNSDR
jgi:hypothetical protein